MPQRFDLTDALARASTSRSHAWAFVRGFATHWLDNGLGDGDGRTETELTAAEERLGLRLPAALREAYRLCGRRRDLTSNHDVLLDPDRLYVDEAGEALVFRQENQAAATWGVLLDRLGDDDPPVSVRLDLADKSAERWEPWLDRLSLCFVEIMLSESLQGDEELCDFLDADAGTTALLEAHATRLPFPAHPDGREPGSRWFLADDVLLRDDTDAVLARGRTPEALARVRELIPGDWLS